MFATGSEALRMKEDALWPGESVPSTHSWVHVWGGVREEGPPFLVLGQRMAFEGEAIRPILAVEVTLVVLDVMIVGDLLADFEERGGQSVLFRFVNRWRLDNEEGHARDRDSTAVLAVQ